MVVVEGKNTSDQKKRKKATPDVVLSILKHRRLIWGRTRLLTFRSARGAGSRAELFEAGADFLLCLCRAKKLILITFPE